MPSTSIRRLCGSAAVLVLVCSAGCERTPSTTLADRASHGARAATSPTLINTPRASIDDATLVAQLRDKLSASTAAEGRAVGVRASDGLVTLTGRVSSISARDSAASLAQDSPGVNGVDNRIVVAQLAKRDSRMQ